MSAKVVRLVSPETMLINVARSFGIDQALAIMEAAKAKEDARLLAKRQARRTNLRLVPPPSRSNGDDRLRSRECLT